MVIKKRSPLLMFLNFILMLTILFSEYIYSSYYSIFSWYENCGTQFLAILMISAPIFLILGVSYHLLSKKIAITDLNRRLPIISLVIFLAPLLINPSLSTLIITIGALLGLCLCLTSVIVFFKSILK